METGRRKLVAFILHMVDDTSLAYRSISNYIWAFCSWNMLQRQADPRKGVERYSEFMQSVKVLAFEVGEPRREIPLSLVTKMVSVIDETDFRMVQAMFFFCIMWFTFSRSETPCPKTFDGKDKFDDKQHWQVRDFDIRRLSSGAYALFVRFKKVKQDGRIQRPEARGDGSAPPGAAKEGGSDWAIIGDIPGHPLSPFKWYRLLMSFYPNGRDKTDPMFMAKDRTRPYTYGCAMADLRWVIGLFQTDVDFGIHGFRVGGYNASLRTNGDELTVAHGLWRSKHHTRYARWLDVVVAGIPAAMVGEESSYEVAHEDGGGRALAQPRSAQRRSAAQGGAGTSAEGGGGQSAEEGVVEEEEEEVVEEVALPEGWSTDDEGRFVPPERFAAAGVSPQRSRDKVKRLDAQLRKLEVALKDVQLAASTRTRHGA
jgi:hypothetical protein